VLHTSLLVERLTLGDRDLPLDHASVVVVARAESTELDWEVVAHTREPEPVARGTHGVGLRCVIAVAEEENPTDLRLEAVDLRGPAFLVRSIERTLVLRGTGPLDGFDLGLLRG